MSDYATMQGKLKEMRRWAEGKAGQARVHRHRDASMQKMEALLRNVQRFIEQEESQKAGTIEISGTAMAAPYEMNRGQREASCICRPGGDTRPDCLANLHRPPPGGWPGERRNVLQAG